MSAAAAASDPVPAYLTIVVNGRRLLMEPASRIVLGRGPEADVDLDHPEVSRHHAILEHGPTGWTLTDFSRNGTFRDQKRITYIELTVSVTLNLGAPPGGLSIILVPADATPTISQGRLSDVCQLSTESTTIGRLLDNDVVLDDLLVSRRHAVLRLTPGGWQLSDLGSGNGTFLNGHRITTAMIIPDDVIGVGHALLQLQGGHLVTYVDEGNNTFEAIDVGVTTSEGKTLLRAVSFALTGRTLLAVIGPSGAGKSTLLGALVGTRPADIGEVRYADRNLYTDYDELRHRIALVPQDDVLHTQLTVRDALTYAGQLRFPADTAPADLKRRVDEVLAELGLTAQALQPITSLSGGQRKRTSVALELLTKPSLLFLDEPTSGLDPGKDRSLMATLRTLADDEKMARTVVVVTHNVANLAVCDRLLLLAEGGWVAYFGPPAGALEYFGESDYADIFLQLERHPGEHWANRFHQSPLHERYIGTDRNRQQRIYRPRAAPPPPPRQQGALTQIGVLCRRYLAVIVADRQYAIFLAVLPLVLSLLARSVPGSSGLSVKAAIAARETQPEELLLVLIIGAALMGAAAAIRELVKERPIYRRERAIGVSIAAYLGSKIIVLSVVAGFQAMVFTALSLWGRHAPDDPVVLGGGNLEIFAAVLGVTIVTMLIGLAISGFIDNADRGMPLLVLMVMVQLIFCGGLFPVHGRPVLEQLTWLAPARWAYSMAAVTMNLRESAEGDPDPLWGHSSAVWFAEAVILLGMATVLTAVIAYQLLRLDPQRRTRRVI